MNFLEINNKVKINLNKILDKSLKNIEINEDNSNEILNKILKDISNNLKNITNNYKFIINGTIIKKLNSLYHLNTSCIWNNNDDGILNFEKEKDEFLIIINAYILSIG